MKYFNTTDNKHGRVSQGFSDTKTGKPDKAKKASKTDDIEVADGTTILVDTSLEVKSLTGKAKIFFIEGASLKINGKKVT